jgi:Kdo2-lipid IVA lauroyltransferase/acyltransferase
VAELRRHDHRHGAGAELPERPELRHHAEWYGFRALTALAQRVPLEHAYAAARRLAHGLFALGGTRQKYALANLRVAYPERSEEERRAIARASYAHVACNLVDLARSEHWEPAQFLEHVAFANTHHVHQALAKGHGLLALIPHLGNFELAKRAAPVAGFPLHVITRPLNNPIMHAYFERESTRTGVTLIGHRRSAFSILRALQSGKPVAVLNDQYIRRSHGIWAPLFGVRCSTSPGVSTLSLRTGAPVVPCYVVRDGPAHHTMYFEEPINPPGDGQVESFTAAQNAALERIIRAHPEQWLWTHRRFRHSPDLPVDPYR